MSYKDQKLAWLAKHPRATTDEAYEAGYLQCIDNYCNKETFTKKTKTMFTPKDGQYYYSPHGYAWGIWLHHDNGDGHSSADFIKDCYTREEAAAEVKKLNKW